MRVVNIHGANDVRVDEVAKPVVGPKDVLLKIDACGICGSDITFARYGVQREGPAPWPLGHEAAGTVVEVGADVSGLAPGLRAVINPMGAYDNIIGNGGAEGAFADYLLIRNAERDHHLLPIPDSMPAARAALVEPLSVALHGVNQAGLRGHEKVVVFGAGPIGLGAVFWLHRQGIENVVAVDLSDARLVRARAMGANCTINPGKVDLRESLSAIHGTCPSPTGDLAVDTDVFLDMAGAPALLEAMLAMGKYHSRLVLTAVYPNPVALDLQTLLLKEITITPAVGYPIEMPAVLSTLAQLDDEELAPYVSHSLPFGRFDEAFAIARTAESSKVMVTF